MKIEQLRAKYLNKQCALDGNDAVISEYTENSGDNTYALVRMMKSPHYSAQFSWFAVDWIMQKDGKFKG